MIQARCQCGVTLELDDAWAGRRGECPHCGQVLDVPARGLEGVASDQGSDIPPIQQPPLPAQSANSSAPAATSPADAGDRGSRWFSRLALPGAALVVVALGIAAWLLLFRTASDDGAAPRDVADAGGSNGVAHRAGGSESSDPSTHHDNRGIDEAADVSSEWAEAETPGQSGEKHPADVTAGEIEIAGLPRPEGGTLSGVSRRYDDLECRRIQARHAIRIPPGATMLEVNGLRLPIDDLALLRESAAPYLFLPRGHHAVRFRSGERHVMRQIEADLASEYAAMQRFFRTGETWQDDELIRRGAEALDVHGAPFLLNLLGGWYAGRGEWEAAERKFNRAILINPAFSPAHLNLAACLQRRQEPDAARRELLLAEAFNVGNVFGLQAAIETLRIELDLGRRRFASVELPTDAYSGDETLATEDQRLIALMRAMSKYAVRREDQGKILNNLAVHFADTYRPQLALLHFRESLAALKLAGPQREQLARRVLSHMAKTCEQVGFAEAEEYERMARWLED